MKRNAENRIRALMIGTVVCLAAAMLFAVAVHPRTAAAAGDISAEIEPVSLETAEIGTIKDRTYTGNEFTPEPSVRINMNGTVKKLKKDKDYTLSYSGNLNAGTAQVLVSGINGYTGTAIREFTIKPAPIKTARLKYSSMTYTGQARTQTKSVVVRARVNKTGVQIEKAGNYTVTYENNTEIGTASLIVTGKGNYAGTILKHFKIVPPAPALTSATGTAKRFTAGWTQPEGGVTGYQLQYSTKKDFSSDKHTKTLKDGSILTKSVKKPVKGAVYYVRVRAYKTVDGKKYYSEWSKKSLVKPAQNTLTVKKGTANGKRTLILGNVPESVTEVSFAVWSETNGQDDCVWYTGKRDSKGRWKTTFNVKKHRNAGAFNVHAYSGNTFLSGGTFTLDPAETETKYTKLAASLKQAEKRSQLILVGASGTECTLVMLNKNDDGSWYQLLKTSGNVGLNGIGEVTEWNRKTPVGVYAFTEAFGISPDPGTALSYTQVDDTYYWVDDVNSPYYNQFVTTKTTPLNWSSAEHIIDYTVSYQYCLALDFNKECVSGAGSAIFLHVGTGNPTLGCIGVPADVMKKIMQYVSEDCRIIIDTPKKLKKY